MPGVLAQHSLSIVMFGLFALFLVGQSIAGHRAYNQEQREHQEPAIGYGAYLTEGHFIEAVFENWESEFLQMSAFVLFTVFLRQRGSRGVEEAGRQGAAGQGSTTGPARDARTVGGASGGSGPSPVRELALDRPLPAVRLLLDDARPRGGRRIERRAAGARRTAHLHLRVT